MSERPSNIPADVWALTEVDAKERADWLVDAVATATQNPAFLRGDDTEDTFATEAIKLNGEKAIRVAMCRAIIAERERCSALLNKGCTLEDGEPVDPAVPEIFHAINQGLRP